MICKEITVRKTTLFHLYLLYISNNRLVFKLSVTRNFKPKVIEFCFEFAKILSICKCRNFSPGDKLAFIYFLNALAPSSGAPERVC
jgi:hypothetical protein